MKHFLNLIAFSLIVISSFAADNTVTNDSSAAQEERLYQRFLKEMQHQMRALQKQDPSNFDLSMLTNLDTPLIRAAFESMVVDPSFGLKWDEVPAPTMLGSNAMSAVNAYVSTNGWNMQTNDCLFDCVFGPDESKPIRGLPWTVIHDREFSAVTRDGILYVLFGGFHHDGHGVAYNPQTNRFSTDIDVFKPIGQHWYVWAFDHEDPQKDSQPREYEGAKGLKDVSPVSK